MLARSLIFRPLLCFGLLLTMVCIGGSGPPLASASVDPVGAHPRAARSPLFSSSSIWGSRVDRRVKLSPLSSVYASRLADTVASRGAWVNTTQWSTPIYTVPKRQPRTRVTVDGRAPTDPLQRAMAAVPIPRRAVPAGDTDAHLVVVQRSTDTMWELWGARRDSSGWHARYGGRMTRLSRSPGYFPSNPGWGGTATGLPMAGGLIRISELRAGRIRHALSLGVPDPSATYAWPAQRTDGTNLDPTAIPEGTRFRIDPRLDLSSVPMSPFTRTLARAAQRYGIYVTDRSDTVAFAAEDPSPTGANPYWPAASGFFGGRYPSELLREFPWRALQVVDAPVTSAGAP